MKIDYVNLKNQWLSERKNLLPIIDKVLSTGEFVGGSEINKFEKNIIKLTESKYSVSLNSGTDALTLALHVLGVRKHDEVITPPNSFIASASCITHIGAKPVFVDVGEDLNINPDLIEKKITKKTKAIIAVHLTGKMSRMPQIMSIAKKYKIKVIEDAAQSIGSKFNKKPAGSYGEIGCFSAHPLKNLNAFGDCGYLVTNNKNIAQKIKILSNHGMESRNKVKYKGYVSRMDNLQAAILNYHIKNLKKIISIRRRNAKLYEKHLDKVNIELPFEDRDSFDTYHTYVIKTKARKNLIEYLKQKNIGTAIHYPVPIHLQPAFKKFGYKKGDFPVTEKLCKEILTLPINQYLSTKQIIYIAKSINNFFK